MALPDPVPEGIDVKVGEVDVADVLRSTIADLDQVRDRLRSQLYALELAGDPSLVAEVAAIAASAEAGTLGPGLTAAEIRERYL